MKVNLVVAGKPELTIAHAAYLAGFFDGEGCISISGTTSKNTVWLQCTVTQKEVEPLLLYKLFFPNGDVYYYPDSNINCPRFNIRGKHASNMLKALLPYLRPKREQAELAIKFAESLPGIGNYHTAESKAECYRIQRQITVLKSQHRVAEIHPMYEIEV